MKLVHISQLLSPYVYFTLLMAGVGALVTSLMLGSLKMQKELNEKGRLAGDTRKRIDWCFTFK